MAATNAMLGLVNRSKSRVFVVWFGRRGDRHERLAAPAGGWSPRSVVVQDRPRGDRVDHGRADGVEELHGEGFVRLPRAVRLDRDRDRLAPDARLEGQGAARRVVVRLRARGAGDRAVIHADCPLTRAAAAHRELQLAAAAVAFHHRGVPDAQRRQRGQNFRAQAPGDFRIGPGPVPIEEAIPRDVGFLVPEWEGLRRDDGIAVRIRGEEAGVGGPLVSRKERGVGRRNPQGHVGQVASLLVHVPQCEADIASRQLLARDPVEIVRVGAGKPQVERRRAHLGEEGAVQRVMPVGGAVHRERPRVFAGVARESPGDGDRIGLLCHDRGRHQRDHQRQNGVAEHEPGDFGALSFHFSFVF